MIERHEKGTVLHILVKSQAKERSIRVANDLSECLVSVKGAPIRGQANREVIKLFARQIGIPSNKIMIISGVSSKRKTILITGLNPADVIAALNS